MGLEDQQLARYVFTAVVEKVAWGLLIAWKIQAALRRIDMSKILERVRRRARNAEMRNPRCDRFDGSIPMPVLWERIDVGRGVVCAVTLEGSQMRIRPSGSRIQREHDDSNRISIGSTDRG